MPGSCKTWTLTQQQFSIHFIQIWMAAGSFLVTDLQGNGCFSLACLEHSIFSYKWWCWLDFKTKAFLIWQQAFHHDKSKYGRKLKKKGGGVELYGSVSFRGVSKLAFKAYDFFFLLLGCSCSWNSWAGRKKTVVLQVLHSFVPRSSEVRDSLNLSLLRPVRLGWSAWGKKAAVGSAMVGCSVT